MFLITGGTGLGAVTAVLAGGYRLTDRRHRLRLDRLAAPKGGVRRNHCKELVQHARRDG